MPTINISLPAQLKAQAEELVAAGEYVSFSDLVRDAVRRLIRGNVSKYDKMAEEAIAEYKAGKTVALESDEDIDAHIEEMLNS